MENKPPVQLRPATPEEVQQALVHALKFNGKKAFQSSRDIMAEITAEHVAEALRAGLFVIMKAAPAPLPLASDCAYSASARRVMERVGRNRAMARTARHRLVRDRVLWRDGWDRAPTRRIEPVA